jgi:hypothetical protein
VWNTQYSVARPAGFALRHSKRHLVTLIPAQDVLTLNLQHSVDCRSHLCLPSRAHTRFASNPLQFVPLHCSLSHIAVHHLSSAITVQFRHVHAYRVGRHESSSRAHSARTIQSAEARRLALRGISSRRCLRPSPGMHRRGRKVYDHVHTLRLFCRS